MIVKSSETFISSSNGLAGDDSGGDDGGDDSGGDDDGDDSGGDDGGDQVHGPPAAGAQRRAEDRQRRPRQHSLHPRQVSGAHAGIRLLFISLYSKCRDNKKRGQQEKERQAVIQVP